MDEPTQSLTDGPHDSGGELSAWGPFRILAKLGQGSFGEVYRAWDPTLEREVALKILRPQADGDDYRSVVREARAVAKVRHPNIVSVYGVDRHEGRVGFWSEFVHGKTLSAVLDAQGPFSPTETALIGAELCRAVSAVHSAGLLHRDIKASNAMREEGGRIRLLDFGLSHAHGEASHFGGTPAYMAPELRRGKAPSAATDIYALGILLYHLATGGYPPDPESSASSSLLDRRPDLPPSFVRIVEKATQPDPSNRYKSAGEMLQALAGSIGSSEPESRRSGVSKKSLAIVAAALIAVGITAYVEKDWIQAWRHGTTSTATYDLYTQGQVLLARYDKLGNTDKAITTFQDAVKRDPKFALGWAGLGRAYWRKRLSDSDDSYVPKALEATNKALELDPELAPVQATLGMIHVNTGKVDVGMAELQKAEKLNGTDAEVQAALSNAYQHERRKDDAKAAMQQAMDLAPTDWRWPYLMASLEINAGDFKKAEEHSRQSLQLSPDNGLAYYNLGVALQRQARYDESLNAFQKSAELTPTYYPQMSLGLAYLRKQEYDQARQAFLRAIQNNPRSHSAWGSLALAYKRVASEKDKSLDAYRKAAELGEQARTVSPNDARLLSDLADYYSNLNLRDKASPLLRQAAALAPDTSDILFNIGTSYENLHDRKNALEFVARALKKGYSVDAANENPALSDLRKDKNAPAAIKEMK